MKVSCKTWSTRQKSKELALGLLAISVLSPAVNGLAKSGCEEGRTFPGKGAEEPPSPACYKQKSTWKNISV